ncbi:hypothetical protein [Burkholderia cepacia]|uniref:hypothetical protein n=1 Tax=Burkholderia cepacia TaxID=292 RepID=UPI001CF491DD|nr:hypothetical protein [Burkholderia cepacia]MCA7934985.1 hypothetical protein [Burkholderia cepacia]
MCGAIASYGPFKTPSLHDTSQRRVLFRNGRFHSLEDAQRFCVRRDTDPAKAASRRVSPRHVPHATAATAAAPFAPAFAG